MIKQVSLALLAVSLLSGCSSTRRGSTITNIEGSLASEFARVAGDIINFGYDTSALDNEAKAILDRQSTWLGTHPRVTAVIEGHCDERGTREYNLSLGERRAAVTKEYLVSRGVEATRLETISYGKERPAAVGNDEASYAQNRRAKTVVK